MIRYKKYRLLKDLPDGSIVGDEYECGKQFNFYFNTRIHKEATAVDEGHRWDTWQVENNPKFFEEIKEEPKEVFTWDDKLVFEWAEYLEEVLKIGTSTSQIPAILFMWKERHKSKTDPKPDTSKERIEVYVSGDGMFGQMVSVRPKSPSWSIPKEKLPAIKQAIELVLNNEGDSEKYIKGLEEKYTVENVAGVLGLFTQQQMDKAREDAFNAAREKPTPHFNAPQFFYPTLESYLTHLSNNTK